MSVLFSWITPTVGPCHNENCSWPIVILITGNYLVRLSFFKVRNKRAVCHSSASSAVDNQWRDGAVGYWLSRDVWQGSQRVHLNFDKRNSKVVALLWLCLLIDTLVMSNEKWNPIARRNEAGYEQKTTSLLGKKTGDSRKGKGPATGGLGAARRQLRLLWRLLGASFNRGCPRRRGSHACPNL